MTTPDALDVPEAFECKGEACPTYRQVQEAHPDMLGKMLVYMCQMSHVHTPVVSPDIYVRAVVEGNDDCGMAMFETFLQDAVEVDRVILSKIDEDIEEED